MPNSLTTVKPRKKKQNEKRATPRKKGAPEKYPFTVAQCFRQSFFNNENKHDSI